MDQVDNRVGATIMATKSDDVLIVQIEGEIDIVSLAALQIEIDQVLDQSASSARIDMTNLRFMDSSGIAVLLRFAERFGPLEIINPSRIIRQIIEVIGISDILRLSPEARHE